MAYLFIVVSPVDRFAQLDRLVWMLPHPRRTGNRAMPAMCRGERRRRCDVWFSDDDDSRPPDRDRRHPRSAWDWPRSAVRRTSTSGMTSTCHASGRWPPCAVAPTNCSMRPTPAACATSMWPVPTVAPRSSSAIGWTAVTTFRMWWSAANGATPIPRDWRVDADVHEVKDHSVATFDRQLDETRQLLGTRLVGVSRPLGDAGEFRVDRHRSASTARRAGRRRRHRRAVDQRPGAGGRDPCRACGHRRRCAAVPQRAGHLEPARTVRGWRPSPRRARPDAWSSSRKPSPTVGSPAESRAPSPRRSPPSPTSWTRRPMRSRSPRRCTSRGQRSFSRAPPRPHSSRPTCAATAVTLRPDQLRPPRRPRRTGRAVLAPPVAPGLEVGLHFPRPADVGRHDARTTDAV